LPEIKERSENGASGVNHKSISEEKELSEMMINGIPLKDIPLIDDSREDLTYSKGVKHITVYNPFSECAYNYLEMKK